MGREASEGSEEAVPDAVEMERGSEPLSTMAGPGLAARPSPLAAEWWGPHRGAGLLGSCFCLCSCLSSLCYMPPDPLAEHRLKIPIILPEAAHVLLPHEALLDSDPLPDSISPFLNSHVD